MEIHLICDEIKPGQSAPEAQSYLPLHVRDKTVCYRLTDWPQWRVSPLQAKFSLEKTKAPFIFLNYQFDRLMRQQNCI